MTAPSRLADALKLAAAGLPTFPCGNDKKPRVKWRESATSDPEVLRQWWSIWPDSLPAVPMGEPSDLWVLDCDVSGDGSPAGERSAAALGIVPAEHPHAIRTRRGGWHLPYRWRADLPRNTSGRLPGIDSRGEGGYVIAWNVERLVAAATDPNLPEPPETLVNALSPPLPEPPKANGHDHGTISDRYVGAAVDAECRAVAGAPEGQRNNRLNIASYNLGQLIGAGVLGRGEAERHLLAAALTAGLPHPEALATIRSGLEAGAANPRRIEQREPRQHRHRERDEHHRDHREQHHEPRDEHDGPPREEHHDQRDRPQEEQAAPKPDGDLPDLIVNGGNLPATARELRDLLATRPMLFDRAGPVRLHHDATLGGLTATPLTVEGVCHEAHAVCRPVVLAKTKEGLARLPTTLPDRVARLYLALHGEHDLRPLTSIASAPLLRDDGTISAGEGYDPETGIYREKCPDVHVPDRPSRADAEAALLHLRRFLGTFPFADAHRDGDGFVSLAMPPGQDESAALVALITAVCRPSLPLAPAVLIRAPNISGAGTGKGLLSRVKAAIAFGRAPYAMPPGHDADEFDKRLVAAAMTAEPVILIDNANSRTLRSDTLAALITERPARIRPLGKSTLTPITTAILPIVTGNGVQLAEDLARRFIVIELDALTEDPESRTFTTDPVAEAKRRRTELLGHVLTIWRWGRQNATTLKRGKPLGSFETWAAWCRDPLLNLGCVDPVERVADVKAEDPHRRAAAEAFQAWWEAHADRPLKAADLAEPVKAVLDPQGRGRQFLARRLQNLEGTRCAGFVLTAQRGEGLRSVTTYQVQRVAPPA
jgi:hypothetical protein